MVDRRKHLRNVAILIALAVVVWRVPGGATGAGVVDNLLSVIFLGGICFFGYRMYMEHRTTLLDMDDRLRTILYGSAAMLVLALIATGRLWGVGGPLILLWFAMIGAAVYGGAVVLRALRQY